VLWLARDTYRLKRALAVLAVLFLGGELVTVREHRGWGHALALVSLQILMMGVMVWVTKVALVLLAWGLAWLRIQVARRWHAWTGLGVVLVLSSLLLSCGDVYKGAAKLVGCDPVAVEAGYCTMPRTLPQGAQR
jgi:hypothetical protein